MTEAGIVYLSQNENFQIVDSLGFVAPNVELRVIDEGGNNLGPNEPGELLVRHPVMMIGYLKNSEETKKLIDEDGWMHTGDRISYNENKEFIYHDRIKEIIKYQGDNISPTEIQEHLLTHPDVLEVAVVAIPHPLDSEWPIAFVKKVPGSKVR